MKPLIIPGYSSQILANDIAESLGWTVVDVDRKQHPSREIRSVIQSNIRKREVVVIASAAGEPNRNVIETELLLGAAKENGAREITLVLPYMFYGREDGKFGERASTSLLNTIARFKDLCDNVVVVDPHNIELTQALFLMPPNKTTCDVVHLAYPFAQQLNSLFNQNIISRDRLLFTYPDAGASKRISNSFRQCLYSVASIELDYERKDEWAQVAASRNNRTNEKRVSVTDDVKGRDIVIFEDMVDTGGTAMDIAKILKEKGARSVILFASNGLFSSKDKDDLLKTVSDINQSELDAVFISDSFNYAGVNDNLVKAIADSPVIHTIKTSPYLAQIIRASTLTPTKHMHPDENSVSSILRGDHRSLSRKLVKSTPLKANSPLLALAN
ncbi:MAG: ribose-phosphate diphosphokinase [Pseudomonadota bacterium]